MHEKQRNDESAKDHFDQRIKETKQKAIEDNIKKAEESGNVLTQILDEEGNLVNVNQVDYDAIPDDDVIMEPTKNKLAPSIANNEIQNVVFDAPNIDTKKTD